MAKRRLSEQQTRRIKKNQSMRSQAVDESTLGEEKHGLIISHFGQQLDVEDSLDKTIHRCFARSNLPALATGDHVVWRLSEADGTGIITALQKRHSIIHRPHQHRGIKPIAANIDKLIIVIANEPTPFHNLIDRYLVAAHAANLQPILLLNKIDLLDDITAFSQNFSIYQQLNYPFIHLSAKTQQGVEEFSAALANQTSIFVGQSGVGKSSLLNSLLPDANTKVDALSQAKAKGKHTTTSARLYHLPNGGHIIDSPGIREFGLWHLDAQTITNGFKEFADYSGLCKFRDCQHQKELGCAIQAAVKENKIDPRRMDSYFTILRDNED